jgi:hypothetical protein
MSWKNFFKPTWIKIIFFVIFFTLSSLLCNSQLTPYASMIKKANEVGRCGLCCDTFCMGKIIGLPLPFYSESYGGIGGFGERKPIFIFLIIDLVFWYILSCLVIWIFNKVRRKK